MGTLLAWEAAAGHAFHYLSGAPATWAQLWQGLESVGDPSLWSIGPTSPRSRSRTMGPILGGVTSRVPRSKAAGADIERWGGRESGEMRRALSLVLGLVLAVMLVSVGTVGAKAPGTSDRTGDLSLWPHAGFGVAEADFPGVAWWGTATFDDVTYGMAFFLTPGKAHPVKSPPFGDDPAVVTHWTEDFEIYADAGFVLDPTTGYLTALPGTTVLWGHDAGTTHWKNFTWLGNGRVDVGEGPFTAWDGRKTHISGSFGSVFADPPSPATGTLRFN